MIKLCGSPKGISTIPDPYELSLYNMELEDMEAIANEN